MRRPSADAIWSPAVYDRFAGLYDLVSRWFFPAAEKAREYIVADLTSGAILDVGCGTGSLLAFAHANGLQCHGIDTSNGMLARAREKTPDAELINASFYDIPYPDETFDVVVATNALSGAGFVVQAILVEMLRVCKRGGEVRIVEWGLPQEETFGSRLTTWLGGMTGDQPQDYVGIFKELGCEPSIEVLGMSGMYQFFKVRKA